MVDRHCQFHSVFTRVAGSGNHARNSENLDARHTKTFHTRSFRTHRSHSLTSTRTLHGKNCPTTGRVVTADDGQNALGVRCVRHDIEYRLAHPPHDDVVGNSPMLVARMRVLCTTWRNLSEIVGELALQVPERILAGHTNRSQVRHIEHGGIVPACHVFGDGAGRIRKRHLPASERNHFGAQLTMQHIEWRSTSLRHAASSTRRCAVISLTRDST